jgi:hypothetical protein
MINQSAEKHDLLIGRRRMHVRAFPPDVDGVLSVDLHSNLG